jgi:copper oxidase (laccase) domain-containing protein
MQIARKTVEWLAGTFGVDAKNLQIWLSPAAGAGNYPLHKFHNQSLRTVVTAQFREAGVSRAQISGDEIDTTIDANYFSHSQGDKTARFAIVAQMI